MAQHLHDVESIMDGEVREIEYRFRSQPGDWRWLKTRETAFSRDEDGRLVEVIGVIQDITANKLAESKLQHRLTSEKLLSNISNTFINLSGPEIDGGISTALELVAGFLGTDYGLIFLIEEDGLVARFTTAGQPERPLELKLPLLEFDQARAPWIMEAVLRHKIVVLNHLDDLPTGADQDRETLAQKGLRSLVLLPMVYNNNLIGLLSFSTARVEMAWSEDDIYVIKTFAEMITSALVQKQVDQALRKSEARYRAIVEEHQTEMICRFLPDATLTFVNEAYCKFYGLSRGELVGTSFLDPVLPDDRLDVRETLATVCTDLPVATHEQRVRLPNGNLRWQEWTSRAIFDQHNDFIEFQSVGRDITLRKHMEEQIKTAQTRLTQAARLASIGELAAGVAHQISNPLTTIIADAQILSQQLDRAHPGRESAEAIIQAGWRAQRVINELMKFSQPSQATHEPISINDTIDKAVLLAGAHIQASGVQLEMDLAPGLPQINGNARQLTDLWVNLLLLARNAFSNSGEHTIRIRSHQNGSGIIHVDVTDNGIPIPALDYEHIFEPQLIPSGEGRGTGLEFSICREIARQNRGQIAISGNEHETTIRISFTGEG
jgi:PAS domain S-box-containing protein